MGMSIPHPHTVLFARGTLARLALWPALRLAVHASWGGPASASKQRWLAGVLVDQFELFIVSTSASSFNTSASASASAPFPPNTSTPTSTSPPPPDEFYVEELLLQIMDDEFDVVLEDGSAAAVARDMLRLFGAVRAGDETFVQALEAQAEKVKGQVPQHEIGVGSGSESDSGSGSDWEDEEGEKESEEPVPRLLNHAGSRTREEEPQVDQDGFTVVKRKARR